MKSFLEADNAIEAAKEARDIQLSIGNSGEIQDENI